MRYPTLTVILLWLTIASAALFAAEPADEQSQQEKGSDTAQEESRSNGSRTDRNGSEIFVPSEEISEDFAVSFPVDI